MISLITLGIIVTNFILVLGMVLIDEIKFRINNQLP